jgi:DSF synthase
MTFLNRVATQTVPAAHGADPWPAPKLAGDTAHGVPENASARSLIAEDPRSAAEIAACAYPELETFITEEDRAFWCFMNPRPRPSFTPQLLRDLEAMQDCISVLFDRGAAGHGRPFDYFILGSRSPGVFNLGGDLNLFVEKIRARDGATLRRYGYACVEAGHANHRGYDNGVITIGLIQGDALGGGLESALSCDLLIAERQAKFGLPEVLFNLFPGMGAYSFLSRRIGPIKAEEMIMSGRIYTAEEMLALGVVDVLAEAGEGQRAARAYIAANRTRRNAHSAIYKVRRRVNPVPLEELRDVVDTWVEAALALEEADLRKMTRIAAAQDRFRARQTGAAAIAAE